MNKYRFLSVSLVLLLCIGCSGRVETEQRLPSLAPTLTPVLPSQTATIVASASATPSPFPSPPPNSLSDFEDSALAYALFRPGDSGIYVLSPLDDTPVRVIGEQHGVVFFDEPSWSPDGERIAFASNYELNSFFIYTIDVDGSDVHMLSGTPGDQHSPAWSPDGNHIVFSSMLDLYLIHPDSSGHHSLVHMPTSPIFPAWSPNGEQIAFLGDEQDNLMPYKIFVINADGSNLRPVTDAIAGYGDISWSPDGRKIAFRTFEGCGDISILDLVTGEIDQLTNTPMVERDAAWSPDGSFLVYAVYFGEPCDQSMVSESYGGASFDIYIMNISGDGPTRVTFDDGAYEPSWWPLVVMQADWEYQITSAGSDLNVREAPSLSADILLQMPEGAIYVALEGPIVSDGYDWWRIRTEDDIEGWIVDMPGWYVLEEAPSP